MIRAFAAAAGLAAAVLVAIAPVAARDCPAPYLCAFSGEWSADGTAFGGPARVDMRWETVLDGKFARIDYSIRPKDDTKAPFAGVGYYRPAGDGAFDGSWFDSQGAMHPLKATFDGARIETYWGDPDGTYWRTTYTLLGGEDAVEIVDEIRRDGVFREFARNTLTRAD